MCLGTTVSASPYLLIGGDGDPTVETDTTALKVTGVSVSPSRLRMNGKPGETVIETIKITNNTDVANSFSMNFFDFDMNGKGKSAFSEPGTGSQDRLPVKHFTILPELIRDFKFNLPHTLEPGRYSAVGVLDFGSTEEIQAAELEFEIEP